MPAVAECLTAIERTQAEMEVIDARIADLRQDLKDLAARLDQERLAFIEAGKANPAEYKAIFIEIEARAKSARSLLHLIRNGRRV